MLAIEGEEFCTVFQSGGGNLEIRKTDLVAFQAGRQFGRALGVPL